MTAEEYRNYHKDKPNREKEKFMAQVQYITGQVVTPEYKFHPTRKWRFDYCFVDQKVAIETEGGVFSGGRHTRGVGFMKDMEKYNEGQRMGYYVLRCTPDQLNSEYVYNLVKDVVQQRI
jgi:hypothetical protein